MCICMYCCIYVDDQRRALVVQGEGLRRVEGGEHEPGHEDVDADRDLAELYVLMYVCVCFIACIICIMFIIVSMIIIIIMSSSSSRSGSSSVIVIAIVYQYQD